MRIIHSVRLVRRYPVTSTSFRRYQCSFAKNLGDVAANEGRVVRGDDSASCVCDDGEPFALDLPGIVVVGDSLGQACRGALRTGELGYCSFQTGLLIAADCCGHQLPGEFLDAVFSLAFLSRHEHVLLVGPACVGKTFLAQVEGALVSTLPVRHYPGWHEVTVSHPLADKGQSLEGLKQLRSDTWHRVVVFGDDINDLALFEAADHAVAVENAASEVMEKADEVIGSNDSGAVIDYLERYSSGQAGDG